MYSEIKISGRAGVAVIDIEGVIGVPEKMQFDNTGERVATYEKFSRTLKDISAIEAPEIIVNIRSTGGDVNDALLIYGALTGLRAKITTRCYGYVASAATIIAQAASPGSREVSSSTLYLIHCCESCAQGNSESLMQAKELLDKTDMRIAEIYAARSGRDIRDYVTLMGENNGKGRWLSAVETIDAGLADKIIEPVRVANEIDEAELNDSLSAFAALAGITLLPEMARPYEAGERIAGGKRIIKLIKAVFDKIFRPGTGERHSIEDIGYGTGKCDTVDSPGSMPVDKGYIFSMRDAQSKAMQTRTLPREDPSVGVGELRRSANQQAYYEDSLSLRNYQ